jgi:hypothetical protein
MNAACRLKYIKKNISQIAQKQQQLIFLQTPYPPPQTTVKKLL